MPRSSWNPHSPDAIGVEFFGVGVTNNVLSTGNDAYALRFKPQATGFVNTIALYSGALTNNPGLPYEVPNYFLQRRPWIVEIIPVSGYDPGQTISSYQYFVNSITASTDCVDEVFTAPDGDELNAIDALGLFQSGPAPMTATVQFDSTGFPTSGVQVLSIALETNVNRQTFVERIDQDSAVGWATLVSPGYQIRHLAEAYRDHGVAGYSLWTPTHVRQFDNAVGNRRFRFRGMDIQPMVYDYLQLHVDYIPERRAGVGIVVPTGPYEWSTATLVIPGTSNPVPLTAGQDYMVVVRAPCGQTDYQSPGSRFDWRALSDVRADGITPVHYTSLDWDMWLPKKSVPSAMGIFTTGLDTQLQGLPGLRLLNGSTETVDTEPYSNNYSGARPLKAVNTSARVKHTFAIISGSTRYRYVKQNVALLNTGLNPGTVGVQLVNSGGTVIAGPVQITTELWNESPKIGQDIFGDEFHQVTVDFGVAVDIDNATATTVEYILSNDAELSVAGDDGSGLGNAWRIGALVSEIIAATGSDQTAPSNASARGYVYRYSDGATVGIDSSPSRRGDLQTLLISEVPAITGTAISVQSMSVSGGTCDGCPTTPPPLIRVMGVGTEAVSADSGSAVVLVPPLPVMDIELHDVILCLVTVRNVGVGTVNTPPGWRLLGTSGAGNLRLFGKVALGSGVDTPPQVTFTSGATNETAIAQTAVIRGAKTDLTTIVTASGAGSFVAAGNLPWKDLAYASTTDLGLRMGWKQDDWTSINAEAGFTRIGTPSSTLGSDSGMIWEYQTGALGWFGGAWTVNGGGAAVSQSLSVSLAAATPEPHDDAGGCFVRSIPYNRVCWTPTTLTQENFTYYEVQRLEPERADVDGWQTVSIIAPTGSAIVTGAAVTGVPSCFDDWSHGYDTEVCYRVRQRRSDGGFSDFIETICGTTPSPTGADIIITAPMMPDHSVAFPEAHGASLPIVHEWEMLDSDQHEYRQVYGRDKFVQFRPLEKLGVRFKRQLIISALCTPKEPCFDVVHGLREVCHEATGLVVRDRCGNRWYAGVQAPTVTSLSDPVVGDIWLADIVVTEVATPVLTAQNIGQVQP